MIPIIAGVGMAAGGSVLNGFGARRQAKRIKRAYGRADRDRSAITDRLLTAQGEAGQATTNALLEHLSRITAGAGTGRAQMAERDAAAAGRVAGVAPLVSQAADPVAQAAQARAGGTLARARGADDALALLSAIRRVEAQSAGRAGTQAGAAQVPLAEARTRGEYDMAEVERRLARALGSPSNSAANMQLVGGLMNIGGQAAIGYGARSVPAVSVASY
jgi:hypothetical protein